jgi:rare lipoprotein A (peptidoglycan hydrolase)
MVSLFAFCSITAINNFNENNKFEEIILNDSVMNLYIISQQGQSSYYAEKFHNKKTASGELMDLFEFSAAHKKLPFGTIVKVTKKANNQSILVRVNDRGPFIRNRVIDLSYTAANIIDAMGIPEVEIEYFDNRKLIEDLDTTYFLGYSISQPLIIIKDDFVNFYDSTLD